MYRAGLDSEVPAICRCCAAIPQSSAGQLSCEVEGDLRSRVVPTMRVLVLAPFTPGLQASHGGGRVVGQLLHHLSRRHEVGLLYLRGPEEGPIDAELGGRCVFLEEFNRCGRSGPLLPRGRQRVYDAWLRLRGTPELVVQHASRPLHARLKALAHAWRPDVIQLEYTLMGQYLPALQRCPAARVLTQHEPAALISDVTRDPEGSPDRLPNPRVWRSWQRYERAVIRQVDAVVTFTESDRHAVASHGLATPIVRIPFGTTPPEQPLNASGDSPPSLLFVGSFIHPPNVDAARRLVRNIFPLIREQIPDAVLYIVGDRPPSDLEAGGPGVIVTGYVPDLIPYLDRTSVVVAPLRTGGGMRVKVAEALAAGKALVASRLAASGLAVMHDQQLLLAETDGEFADAITDLLRDPERRVALAGRARAWACAHLEWEESIRAYEGLYESLTKPKR
jgi:polysaccharide biosynthesis protein PslH